MKISFKQLMGKISEGIAITDPRQPDNPIVYVNSAFCKLTGYTQSEVLGRNCRFLQGPDTDQQELERLRSAIRDRKPCVVELLNYRSDGTRFWNNLSINPVYDADGQLTYFTGIQMDVTRRRQLEEKQREFVSNLAHELKTPIAALMGLTDTLDRQPDIPDATRHDINNSIQTQLERLNQTVESILDLSRIDFEGLVKSLQLIDLRDIVQESVETVEDYANTHQVSIEIALPDEPVLVLGDPWTLSMLTGNLLNNAVKYGGARNKVDVRLTLLDHICQLSVADQGTGIDDEHQQLIFDRFYRIDKSRSRINGGTGLGLSIVAEVAKRHRGYAGVESSPGKGSIFKVTLPLYQTETVEQDGSV